MRKFSVILSFLFWVIIPGTEGQQPQHYPCSNCDSVEITSASDSVHQKHNSLLGTYHRLPELINSKPAYKHYSGYYYLYYNLESQGFWAVGETLGSDVVRFENQGDRMCPYFLKSLWRYADGELNALIYDVTLSVVCLTEPCSIANCGFQASCVNGQNRTTVCQCNRGFIGNPYERCYPSNADFNNHCHCRRLLFTTENSKAIGKQENSYGEYFLYGEYNGRPVYQHFAGVEYLYYRDGNWLISDKIGLKEAGMQNQGEENPSLPGSKDNEKFICPYRFRTSWEYADIDQPGWQWVYDHSAKLICPSDPCSVTRCGFYAKCNYNFPGQTNAQCTCQKGYVGDPYKRCYPILNNSTAECSCNVLRLNSTGTSALAQSDKMGLYHLVGTFRGHPAYQHESGLDYLYFAEGDAWVIGATYGGSRVGIVNFNKADCPYKFSDQEDSSWHHSISGQLQKDELMTLECVNIEDEVEEATNQNIKEDRTAEVTEEVTTTFPITTTTLPISTTTLPTSIKSTFTYPCTCPEIIINSTNPSTINKHGNQLGTYRLLKNGHHPIYKRISLSAEDEDQYLYYQESSGGNWLINSEIGLLYGGIQNSEDVPICPYLINAMWQFGDSDLGGWQYDKTLSVTCPTDACSLLKCGFRARCVVGIPKKTKPRCECQPGFRGDPYTRCFPENLAGPCVCQRLKLSSNGEAVIHQRDKIGLYYLWGYYKDGRPVYQHESGLDFIYYHHRSRVWAVGPDVGGNSAGLLNFDGYSAGFCPYGIKNTPWEYGTKIKTNVRRIDPTLKIECDELLPNFSLDKKKKFPPLTPNFQHFNENRRHSSVTQQLQHQSLLPSSSSSSPQPHHHHQCGMAYNNSNPWHVQIASVASTSSSNRENTDNSQISGSIIMKHVCSGVIISPVHVLTAASCLIEYPLKTYRVIAGRHNLIEPGIHEKSSWVLNAYLHDEYNNSDHDIAIIKLREPLSNGEVNSVCLDDYNTDFDNTDKENLINCYLSGWNLAETQLSHTPVSMIKCDKDNCSIKMKEICPSLDYGGGTPLICHQGQSQKNILMGIIGGGRQNCSSHLIDFRKIRFYGQWISSRLAL